MSMSNETELDAFEEIERCLWRMHEAVDKNEWAEWADEVDSEVGSLMRNKAPFDKIELLDRLVAYLGRCGIPDGLMPEVSKAADIRPEDLEAYRLDKTTPETQQSTRSRRI